MIVLTFWANLLAEFGPLGGGQLSPQQLKAFGLVAVVVLAEGATLSAELIRDAIRDRVANFKVPKKVLFIDELPRNAMGKVQKDLLRKRYC